MKKSDIQGVFDTFSARKVQAEAERKAEQLRQAEFEKASKKREAADRRNLKRRNKTYARRMIKDVFQPIIDEVNSMFAESQKVRVIHDDAYLYVYVADNPDVPDNHLDLKALRKCIRPLSKTYSIQVNVEDGKFMVAYNGSIIDPQYRGYARETSVEKFVESVARMTAEKADHATLKKRADRLHMK